MDSNHYRRLQRPLAYQLATSLSGCEIGGRTQISDFKDRRTAIVRSRNRTGEPGWTRTTALELRRLALSPSKLQVQWRRGWDSNPCRPKPGGLANLCNSRYATSPNGGRYKVRTRRGYPGPVFKTGRRPLQHYLPLTFWQGWQDSNLLITGLESGAFQSASPPRNWCRARDSNPLSFYATILQTAPTLPLRRHGKFSCQKSEEQKSPIRFLLGSCSALDSRPTLFLRFQEREDSLPLG